MRRRFSPLADGVDEPILNLTPLIDVVFIVLITFIVVAPLLELDRVQLAPTTKREQRSVEDSSSLTIHVREDNSLLVNGVYTASPELAGRLGVAFAADPSAIPQLFHDQNARFGTYQFVKQAVEEAGYTELDIILEPS